MTVPTDDTPPIAEWTRSDDDPRPLRERCAQGYYDRLLPGVAWQQRDAVPPLILLPGVAWQQRDAVPPLIAIANELAGIREALDRLVDAVDDGAANVAGSIDIIEIGGGR